jgi:hypothetical protein
MVDVDVGCGEPRVNLDKAVLLLDVLPRTRWHPAYSSLSRADRLWNVFPSRFFPFESAECFRLLIFCSRSGRAYQIAAFCESILDNANQLTDSHKMSYKLLIVGHTNFTNFDYLLSVTSKMPHTDRRERQWINPLAPELLFFNFSTPCI